VASQGDRDKVLGGHSFHSVRPDAFNYVWDNSIEQVLEVSSGEVVEFSLRDASDEQIQANSTSEDVAKLDFSHVNPVSGPVYVQGAQPGDVLAVEILEFRPREWGWTALIPGFGLLADEFPEPWLRISSVDVERGRVLTLSCPPRAGGATWTPSIGARAQPSTCRLAWREHCSR
jgi:acetamidase/formamidase